MKVIRREWYGASRTNTYHVLPLGDVHLGAAACDENLLRAVVRRIEEDEACYWIGMGDYCDFINMKDPRFSVESLAGWIGRADMVDLARAQRDRFLEIVKPIAGKCLALVEGNHEAMITKHYERDIFREIVSGVKEFAGRPADYPLGLGVYGWLLLRFYRDGEKRHHGASVTVNLHHGFTGGRLAGAKALSMQRWLWTHECDLALFGHSHNTGAQVETIEWVDKGGKVRHRRAIGAYCGTFLNTVGDGVVTYSEAKGYMPMPTGHVEVLLRPGAEDDAQRVRVVSG